MGEPWRPTEQPECEPDCTCHTLTPEPMTASERSMRWPEVPAEPAGGGDRLRAYWDRDPSPVAEPPEPKGAAGVIHTQVHVPSQVDSIETRVEGGGDPGHVNLIRRILNATNRKDKP